MAPGTNLRIGDRVLVHATPGLIGEDGGIIFTAEPAAEGIVANVYTSEIIVERNGRFRGYRTDQLERIN